MSLIIAGDASIVATGGTGKTFSPTGQTVQNGVMLTDASVTDFTVRPSITARYTPPKLLSDGSYTKGKMSMAKSIPMVLANGKTVFNLVRTEIEIHPAAAVPVLEELRVSGCQMLDLDSTDNFWGAGVLVF